MPKARLIYGATYMSETLNSDLFWMVKMPLGDPHYFFEFERKNGGWERILLTSSLEFTRARVQACNCRVVNVEGYFKKAGARSWTSAIKYLLKERGVKVLEVHPLTPVEVAEKLKKAGIKIIVGQAPWYEERLVKTGEEIKNILEVQGHVEEVLHLVEKRFARARVKNNFITENGRELTSEEIRLFIESELFRRGCASFDTIVSSGSQTAIPHHTGAGRLRAHGPIIFDIYPYSRKTGYFSDMTRTFCKGEPDEQFLKMYEAVFAGQELGISMVRAGKDGKEIHEGIVKYFIANGFRTDSAKGYGFIHGTGHGLGLLCHEPPGYIGDSSYILPKGLVVSVEPGLYYPAKKMGVRIEDLVLVTAAGCRNLTSYPKQLKDILIP